MEELGSDGRVGPYPKGGHFDELFGWHLDNGTRPNGVFQKWKNTEFSLEMGLKEPTGKSVRNWRNGDTYPADINRKTIIRLLFGDNEDLKAWRNELAFALPPRKSKTLGIPTPFEPAGRIAPPPPHFLGRDADIAAILNVLRAAPGFAAILVHGGPGIGKTTLTRAVANHPEAIARFGEGNRWFVPLETAETAEAMKDAIVRGLGRDPVQGLEAALKSLGGQAGLLVLDNLETPWDPKDQRRDTESVLARLAAVPGLALLASFRGRDKIAGLTWALAHPVTHLGDGESVDLFERVAERTFAGDPHLAKFVTALGGIPLAIELAAKRAVGDIALSALWRQWEKTGTEMAADPDYDPTRLNSLPHSIELSRKSSRMTDAAHRLFRLLGKLPAGLAEEDRDALLGDAGFAAEEALRRIGLAVMRAGRLDLLPPIRDHAARRHPPKSPDDAAWPNHYLTLTRTRGETIGTAAGEGAVARLLPELPNIEAAIRDTLAGRRLGNAMAALYGLYRLTLMASAPTPVLTELAQACRTNGDILGEAYCIERSGDIALQRSEHKAARDAFEQARLLYKKFGSHQGEADCILSMGDIALQRSEHEAARDAFERARLLYKKIGDLLGEANCIQSIGDIALQRSEHEAARGAFEQARYLYKMVGDLLGEANCTHRLGYIALGRFEYEAARHALEQAKPLYKKVGDLVGEANCILSMGDIALAQNDAEPARENFAEALELYRRIPAPYGIGCALERLACMAEGAARAAHIAAARAAWTSIDRPDLVAKLDAEFGPP